MRKHSGLYWLVGSILLFGMLACGGFFVSTASPTLPWSEATRTVEGLYAVGVPPTVTPTTAQSSVAAEGPPTAAPPQGSPTAGAPVPSPTGAQPAASPLPAWPPTPTPRNSLRPGPQLVAYALREPIVTDGYADDWPADLPWYDLTQVTYGFEHYQGPHDLRGRFRVAWDQDYLYLFWDVTDDVFVQTQRGALLYKGDSVEILVDTNLARDFYNRYLDVDDYQIGFSPGSPPGQNPEAWLWYPQSLAGPVLGVRVAARPTEAGYMLEAAVPWHRLNLMPYPGLDVGFATSISDDDVPGSALQQTLISSSPFRHLTDPTTWGELLLVARGY